MSSIASEQQKQIDSAPPLAKDLAGGAGISPDIAKFYIQVNKAAVLLSTAFVEDAVTDFIWKKQRRTARKHHGSTDWYLDLMDHGVECAHEVGKALVHPWRPSARAERHAMDAFMHLTELTPLGGELLRICQYDRPKAFYEMSKALDIITQQFKHSARLVVEAEAGREPQLTEEKRFVELRVDLLEKAGGGLSLTETARLLGVTRQAVHKRVTVGTILGMMNGDKLVLPKAQFVDIDGRVKVLPGIAKVLRHFRVAGNWSALQFLVEPDPNLADIPFHALKKGRIEEVSHAAMAYLGIDEN